MIHVRRYPVDLSARMAVCDANYIRILKLFPDFSRAACRSFTLPAIGENGAGFSQHVVLEIVEKFKYTSTVSMRLRLPEAPAGFYRPPEMLVRLYHDASTAEVVSYQEQRTIREVSVSMEVPRYYPDEKEQLNLFLAEWLTLCLETGLGHHPAISSPSSTPGMIPTI